MSEDRSVVANFQLDFSKWNIVIIAVAVSALLTVLSLATYGIEKDGIVHWLDATGRSGAVTFTAAFIASPLHKLFPSAISRDLLKNRRFLGIAFGFQHLFFHLPAVIWFLIIAQAPIAIGGIGFVLVTCMLITSFPVPAKWIGPRNWQILHKTGMFYLCFIFLFSFWPKSSGNPVLFSEAYLINYAAFELALILAVGLRVVAFIRQKLISKAA